MNPSRGSPQHGIRLRYLWWYFELH
uniref:Uncharacterized protein n=1 Tax=Arundo donax TaxID=35708 RepID=A0A0A9GNY5_ARUDO